MAVIASREICFNLVGGGRAIRRAFLRIDLQGPKGRNERRDNSDRCFRCHHGRVAWLVGVSPLLDAEGCSAREA